MTAKEGLTKPNLTSVQRRRIERWCEELESGLWPQTRSALHDTDGLCCLGVACAVFAKRAGLSVTVTDHGSVEYNAHSGYLPDAMVDWLGLGGVTVESVTYSDDVGPGHDLKVVHRGYVTSLGTLNDGEESADGDGGMSFAEIAAVIRRNYL